MPTLVGCTGWGYDDWKGGFYPPGTPPSDYLRRYARVFKLAEIDSTYYRAPTREQAARWDASTPGGFVFAPKMPGAITHEAKLRGTDGLVAEFLAALDPLRRSGKLGPVVAQFPHSFRREKDEPALRAFVQGWPKDQRLVVELRDASWWTQGTYDMLAEADVPLVWSTTEHGRTPAVVTSDTVYLRLIGDRELTRFDRIQRDHTEEMRFWKRQLEREAEAIANRFILLNNHLMGFAPMTALKMAEVLGLPKPDLSAAARDGGQRSLFG